MKQQGKISQDEFLARVKKQQALLRKLFASKKRRQEEIQEAVNERYGHLVGKFITSSDIREDFLCIKRFDAVVDEQTDEVTIVMRVKALEPIRSMKDEHIYGVYTDSVIYQKYMLTDQIDQLLADKFVSVERVAKRFNEIGAAIASDYGLTINYEAGR